jgi:hypothetical protein
VKYVPAWVPGAGFQRIAAEWRQDMLNMVNQPFEFVKKGMASGRNSGVHGLLLILALA